MKTLVDSNVLIARIASERAEHQTAIASVSRLLVSGDELCVMPQNIAEFWSVASRPAESNGLGRSFAETAAAADRIEQTFTLLAEDPAIYAMWKSLVTAHQVVGLAVFDARLAAAMLVHKIDRILTFNAADFTRYGVAVLDPATV